AWRRGARAVWRWGARSTLWGMKSAKRLRKSLLRCRQERRAARPLALDRALRVHFGSLALEVSQLLWFDAKGVSARASWRASASSGDWRLCWRLMSLGISGLVGGDAVGTVAALKAVPRELGGPP